MDSRQPYDMMAHPGTDAIVTGREPGHSSISLADQIKTCLKEPFPAPGASFKLYVHSEEDFRAKMKAYKSLHDQDHGPELDDYPGDVEAQKLLVQQLVEAMTNMEAQDKDARIPVGRVKKLSPFELNLMGWAVLLEIREVQRGLVGLTRWGKDFEYESCNSFGQRFELVRDALWNRKTVVSSLFDHAFIKRLALQPSTELRRKETNKELNHKRKLEHQAAKRLTQQHQARPTSSESVPPARACGGAGMAPSTPAEQRYTNTPRYELNRIRRKEMGRRMDGMGPTVTNAYVNAPVSTSHVVSHHFPASHLQLGQDGQWSVNSPTLNETVFTPLDLDEPVQRSSVYHTAQTTENHDIDHGERCMGGRQSTQTPTSQHTLGSQQQVAVQQDQQLASAPQNFSNVQQWLEGTDLAGDADAMGTASNNGLVQSQEHTRVQAETTAVNKQALTSTQYVRQDDDAGGKFMSDAEFQQIFDSPAESELPSDEWWKNNGYMFDLNSA